MTLAWDQNTEQDLAGYKIYWGTQSKNYQWSEFIGKNVQTKVKNLSPGIRYYFAVSALDYWGNESELSEEVNGLVSSNPSEGNFELALYPNIPNPFNPRTLIRYSIPERTTVTIEIINAIGQKIKTLLVGEKEAGIHQITWDGTNHRGQVMSSGVYFCSLILPWSRISKPITFLH